MSADTHVSGQPAPPFVPGYRLIERLGAGGMASVWLGVEERTRVRRAVKVVAASADPELRLRFLREAEAMARVDDHPNIVRVHAAGADAGGAWLVMDLAAGGDLERRLRRGPLAPDEVLALGRALARALAHVHARGVLHRDLKPANVLFDEQGAPRLVDFGLARLQGAERLSLSGALLGTPVYMAPEQAKGLPADERSDVYGLGAVLYHALTGRPPVRSGPLLTVLAHVIERTPTPPGSISPDTSPALEAAVLRALAKAPEERFQSAADLAAALDRAAVDPGVRARSRVPAALLVSAGLAVALAATALLAAPPRGDGDAPAPVTEGAGDGVASPGPVGRVDVDALRASLLRDDPAAALTILRSIGSGEGLSDDGLAWAAAACLLAGDRATAARLAANTPGDGPGGDWLRAVARALSGENEASARRAATDVALRDVDEASERVARWTFTWEMAADLEGALAPLLDLVGAAERAGRRAPAPVALALGVRAQRALCEPHHALLDLIETSADYPRNRERCVRLLQAACDLAPASRPALGLQVIAAACNVTMEGRRGSAPSAGDPALTTQVDALPAGADDRYAWVRGLHGAVWLASARSDDLDEVERRWAAFEAFARERGLLDGEGRIAPGSVRLVSLAIRARVGHSTARLERAWSLARRGQPDEAARAAALEAAERTHGLYRPWQTARVLLLGGDAAGARARLEGLRDADTAIVHVECGLAEGDADAVARALASLEPDARRGLEEHGLFQVWSAVTAALRGDAAAARAALRAAEGRDLHRAVSFPWRSHAETARQVEAILAGTWRPAPGQRPFPPLY